MRSLWLPSLLSLLAGVAHAAAMAAPWDGQPVWWLQLLALGLLAWLLDGAPSWRRAALWGWLFALAWLTGTFWWLFISMHTYGGLPAVLAVLAVLALAGILALYYAAACGRLWSWPRSTEDGARSFLRRPGRWPNWRVAAG